MGCPCNGITSAAVTIDKPCEGGNCLVTNLSVGIGAQNLDEVGYDVGDANIVMAAPLTGEAMYSTSADGRDRIAQSTAKGVRGRVAGVTIQKAQTAASHRQIRMAECRDLQGGHGDLIAETPSAFLREREPSVDKIMSDFKVSPCHFGLIPLTATEHKVRHPICRARDEEAQLGACSSPSWQL
jgi:hypothetical protein